MSLITLTLNGLYCPQADVYIDPWKKVPRALITHAHADHARKGHGAYLSQHQGVGILKHRLGKINIQGIAYEEVMNVHGVEISFHPAGHVLGSAQIKLQNKKESWVITGDYKLEDDGVSEPYVPVTCDNFVTESTFGLPVFKWQEQERVYEGIDKWWANSQAQGIPSFIAAYSLGKAQRVLRNVDETIGPIITHPAVEKINALVRQEGVYLPETLTMEEATPAQRNQSLIICPGRSIDSKWSAPIQAAAVGVASGRMALRSTSRRRQVDRGFVLSDHVDWTDLNKAVEQSGAHNIYVTHGYSDVYTRYLIEQGYNAKKLETAFEGEGLDPNADPDKEV